MQNNIITKISPCVRIFVLLILTVCLILAKSIYLILFITTLTLVLFVITNKTVNLYVKALKKMIILLLIFLVTYIIIFKQYSIVSIVVFAYKLLIIGILVKIFLLNIEFNSLHQGLYGFLLPIKKLNLNVEKISLDITLSLYFMKFLIKSKEKIKTAQIINGKKITNIKNFVLPSIIYSINKINCLQDNLKVKFYKLNYKKVNFSSKVVFILFVALFVACLFKEVVL